jgi:Tfp pilus assembly protein PilZ
MQTSTSKDKRTGIRVPLLSETITYFYNGEKKSCSITDITNDGLFLKTTELLTPRSEILLQLELPGDLGFIQVNAKVIRVNWTINRKKGREAMGMGLAFENVPANIKKILEAYVVYLRNKQIITVSKRIIEEFFGSEGGPKKTI